MKVLPPLFFLCARGRRGFAPKGARSARYRTCGCEHRGTIPAGMGRGFPLARGARSAPLGKGFAIPSPTFPGITAGIALGVRDSRPLLPSVARPTSPSIHRAAPAAPRLLVFRRWVKIRPTSFYEPWYSDKEMDTSRCIFFVSPVFSPHAHCCYGGAKDSLAGWTGSSVALP